MDEFSARLKAAWPELDSSAHERLVKFRNLLLKENEKQNLTRITEPGAFIEGHLEDVRHLLNSGLVDYPAMDLGSGGGIPGIPASIVGGGKWILAESEGRKAAFLEEAVRELGLGAAVRVFSGRAEAYLGAKTGTGSIVARAVGPVERIYSWIRRCSTWNNLVLLKGPSWEEEWSSFKAGRYRGELKLVKSYPYTVGTDSKKRLIVRLDRVPRGTKRP